MKNKFNFKSIILTLTLLTLGVGQVWADWYVQGSGTGLGGWGQGAKMTQNPASTSIYYRRVSGTCEFKVTSQEDGYTGEKGSGAINNSHAGANVTLSNSNGNIKSTQSGTWYICYDSSTEKVYAQTSLPAPAPTAVVSGSSFMFYIKSYNNWKHAVTPNSTINRVDGTYAGDDATSWVTVTSAQKSTYTYITNNRTGWGGKQNSNISSSKGGELYQANDNVTTTARKTASTTASVSGDVLSISTTTDATSGVYGSMSLYIQYYIDGTFAGVTYSLSTASYGSITAGGATARTSTYDVSGLTNGTHKLKTVLTDGNIFWVPDSVNFTVAHVYSITYKDEGNSDYSGSNLASLPSSYTYGTGIATLTDGVRAGYSFVGWYDTKECDGSKITSISSSATGAKTLYAKWELDVASYTLTYGVANSPYNNGSLSAVTVGGAAASSGSSYTAGSEVSLTASPTSHYHVKGWYSDNSCASAIAGAGTDNPYVFDLGGNTTVYVGFEINQTAITLDRNGGTAGSTSVTATYGSALPSFTAHSRSGYTLNGYYTTNTSGGTKIINEDGTLVQNTTYSTNTNPAKWNSDATSLTLYAQWTEVKSTVTVNANQTSMGTLTFSSTSKSWGTTASVGVATTQSITATANSGYVFDRWVLSGGAATASSLTSGTITLKGNGTGADGIAKAVFGKTYYYRGDNNSWGANLMTRHEDGYYAYYQTSGTHTFQCTPVDNSWDVVYYTCDNSYGNITLSEVDNGYGGTKVSCPESGSHYICILYPGTAVNDGANPLIFASTTLPDLAPETTYATTFYAGDHGAINAKGTAIAKNGNASVNIGATARALTATPESGYSFDKWVTTGSVTVTDPYSASTTVSASAAGGTVTATYLQNSGWHMHGQIDGAEDWCSEGYWTSRWPMDRPYRGVSGVYYRRISSINNAAYFGVHDGTNKYSGDNSGSDFSYDGSFHDLVVNNGKCFKASNAFSNKWVVINTASSPKKIWIQDAETCHTVTVSNDGAKGTVVLKTDNHGNLTTTQFTNGETIRVEIDTMAHYSIASVTLGATNVTMTHSSGTKYTGTAVMPNSDVTLTVTYTPWYTIHYEKVPTAGGKTAPWANTSGNINDKTITSDATYVISGTTVYLYAATQSDGYTYYGWYSVNNPGKEDTSKRLGTSQEYSTSITTSGKEFYAIYFENDYTVTVNAGTGGKVNSLSSTTVTGHVTSLTNLPTATADPGYYFVNWTTTAGTLTNSTSATTGKINGLTSTATVTANFAPIWTIAGLGGDWNTNKLPLANTYVDATVNYAYLDIDTLRPNTDYEFKAIQRSQGDPVWWTAEVAAKREVNYGNSNTRLDMMSGGTDNNFYMHTAGAGTYTFDINLDNSKHPIKVHYPTSYTVTFGAVHGTVTATVEDATTITTGQYAAEGKDITFAQTPATGYTFDGWYDAESGGSAISCMSSDSVYDDIAANISVYAQYDPKEYTVTLTNSGTGYGSGGQANLTATYDAAFPSITLPTAANGYAFMGYWSAANGEGTQFTNASGVLLANITDYSDESGNWKYDASDLTLYAYYKKAEITEITLNATAFEPVEAGDEGYVVANPTIAPTPVAPTMICWELLYDNDNPVPSGHDASAYTEGDTKPNQVRFSIAGLAAGSYKVRATLHTGDGACGTGTTLSVQEASFTIASDFTVTILYKCGDATIKSSTTNPGKALEGTSITAPDIIGYTFSKWKAGDGVTIDGADGNGEKATATITYTANYNGSLTAIYTRKRMIYFYNTLGWSDVYVYFYQDGNYWDGDNGTGTDPTYYSGSHNSAHKGHMLPIEEGSSIYYFDAEGASIPSGYTNIAFTEKQQDNCWYFYDNNKVVRRGDYKATTLPMFVPLGNQPAVNKNSNTAKYYCKGYWMNYPENTGYTLRIYSTPEANNATGASREYLIPYSVDKKMPLKQDVEFNFSGESWFIIYRNDGNYLEGSHTFKQTDHDDKVITSTDNAGTASKMRLISDGEGIYTFTLSFHGDDGKPEAYNYYINVDFPAAVGDYRIVYKDNATWSQGTAHNASWYHPSKVIPKIKGDAAEAKKDTVSFFISKGAGITSSMKFQYISAINASTGAVTWTDVVSGGITIPDYITEAGVYNFIVTQPVGGGSISLEKAEPYTGNYYIRTDNAGNTKWDNYRSRDHQMVYTEFSMSAANTTGEKYSHYFASWCERGTNIKFCIANDYSSCISDTLGQDVGNPYKNTDEDGTLKSDGATYPIDDKYSANVRFMYNEITNKICRAYVGSSTNPARKFLMLEGNVELHGDDDEAITDWDPRYALILADKQNWIYERTLKIKPRTRFKLYSNYAQQSVDPDSAQYFRGAYDSNRFTSDDNSVILIDGSVDADYQMARVIYDFKTNRLMTAWIPSGGAVVGELEINADVLVEREHHEPAQYITFQKDGSGNDGELTGVKTVYGAMKFNRWILNNRGGSSDDDPDHARTTSDLATYHAPLTVGQQKSIYERSLYFISFPFDVNANEIFGFGHYWDEWYLEYYDGLNRAKNGYWEDSPPNWKYVTPSMLNDFVLKANEGYILGLDLDFMKADNFDFWSNGISTVELFFPSTAPAGTLQQTNCTIPALSAIEGDPYRCTINRGTTEGDRRVKDSYWRCLGVPSFNIYNTSLKDASGTTITWQPDGDALPFIYAWNKADNTLTAQSTSTFTFLPMHAYLVQNGGEIRWTNVSAKPASPIVARRVNDQPEKKYEWRLALMSDSILIDQTYIKMSNLEQVTDTFDFNQDLIKEFNTYRSDIYTYIGNERVAANSMPLQTEQTTVIPVGVKIKTAGEYTFAMPDGTNGVGVTLIDTETGVRTSLGLMDYTVTLTAGSFNQRFFLEISPVSNVATDIEEVTGDGLQVTGVRKVLIDNKLFIIKDGEVYDARGAMVK